MIEKEKIVGASLGEKTKMKLHMVLCPGCQGYNIFSSNIDAAIKATLVSGYSKGSEQLDFTVLKEDILKRTLGEA